MKNRTKKQAVAALIRAALVAITLICNLTIAAAQTQYLGSQGELIGTSDSRMVATINETDEHVTLQVMAIGPIRADGFSFALVYQPSSLVLTDHTFTNDIPLGLNPSDLGSPVITIDPAFAAKFGTFTTQVMNHQQITVGGGTGMRSLVATVYTASTNESETMLLNAGEIIPVYTIYFKKQNPGTALQTTDLGYYNNQGAPRAFPQWVYRGVSVSFAPGSLNESYYENAALFFYRSPSSVTTHPANNIANNTATLNSYFIRGKFAPANNMIASGLTGATNTGRINYDTIRTHGFIYTKELVTLSANGITNKLTIDGAEYDFPDAAEIAAGTFTRDGKVFYITSKNNTVASQAQNYFENITGLIDGTEYDAWAFIEYAFQTSESYISIGDKTSFTTFANLIPTAGRLYVKQGAIGNSHGGSWANATPELAYALKYAADNPGTVDEIWVAAGTYKPLHKAGNGTQDRDRAFVLVDGVKLYGGFPADANDTDHTTLEKRALPPIGGAGGATILSGDFNNDDIIGTPPATGAPAITGNTENAYHVVVAAGNSGSYHLDGFCITGGNADGTNTITINGRGSILRFHGGGVYANTGGTATVTLTNSSVYNNTATGNGGGVYATANATADATATAYGTVTLTNSSVYNNTAIGNGGGVYATANATANANATVNIYNSIAWGNTANGALSNLYAYKQNAGGTETITLANSLIGESSLPADVTDGGNNLYATDPQFTDAANGDLSLRPASPAIDAGSNQLYTDAGGSIDTDTDLAGNPRKQGTAIDIGAYELQHQLDTPIALANQSFCGTATIADLVASVEAGCNLVWYDALSALLNPADALVDGETYYAKAAKDGEESSATPVTVSIIATGLAAPTAANSQVFCPGSLASDLKAEGYGIVWYDAATNGNLIAPYELLIDGNYYYAVQKISSCESAVRTAVKVTIEEVTLSPPAIAGPQYFCDHATLADIATDGGNVVWYSEKGALLPSTTTLSNNTTYYASYSAGTCESTDRTPVLVYTGMGQLIDAPDIAPIQYFDEGALVQNIVVPNNSIVWYASAAGGDAIPPSTLLTDNTVYYAAQKAGECESSKRTAVKILFGTSTVVNPTPQVFCGTATLADITVGGSVTWYDAATGGSILPSTTALAVTPTVYYAEQSSVRTAVLAYVNEKPNTPTVLGDIIACAGQQYIDLTAAITLEPNMDYRYFTDNTGSMLVGYPEKVVTPATNTSYYVKAVNPATGCESASLAELKVEVNSPCTFVDPPEVAASQAFCDGATVADLAASVKADYDLLWYSRMNMLLDPADALVDGETYYAVADDSGTESSKVPVTVTIAQELTAPAAASPQTFCSGSQVSNLVATGSNVVWYDAPSGGNLLNPSETLVDGQKYYAVQTTPNGCESGVRTEVRAVIEEITLNPPAIVSPQSFCSLATLADIATDGSNIVWYDAATEGNQLPLTTPLVDGYYYYAAYSAGTCQSATRTAVTVSIGGQQPAAPAISSPQRFCGGATIQNIAVPNNQIIWYTSAVGGALLSSSTMLAHNTVYYAAQKAGDCESTERVPVKILFDNPAGPEALSPQAFCGTAYTLADLEVSGSGIVWYDASAGGNQLPSSTMLTTTPTIYYAAQSAGTCKSSRVGVLAYTSTPPAMPVISGDITVCADEDYVDLTSVVQTVPGITYTYYSDNGITEVPDPTQVSTPFGNTAYYVKATSSAGCESASLAQINVNVSYPPVASTIPTGAYTGINKAVTLTIIDNNTNPAAGAKTAVIQHPEIADISLVNGELIVTGKAVGTSSISYTSVNENGCTTTLTIPVTVTTKPIDDPSVTVSPIDDLTYTGSAITPKPIVKDGATVLVENTDYTLGYSNNTDVGTATITITGMGSYTGNTSVTFEIVSSSNTDVADIAVAGSVYSSEYSRYVLTCGTDQAVVTITTDDVAASVSYNGVAGKTFTVAVKPGANTISFTVTASDGQTSQSYSITVVKPFVFGDIIQKRWDNTLTVINNPANNGGYTFTSYQWYYNGAQVGTGQSYSAGSDGQVLPAGEYYVVLTANELTGSITTCSETVTRSDARSSLVVYPNPVRRGNTVTISSDLTKEAGAVVELFNLSGIKVSSQPVRSDNATITAPNNAGTYILRITAAGQEETFKLIVE